MARQFTEEQLRFVIENAPDESTRAAARRALVDMETMRQTTMSRELGRAALQGATLGLGPRIESAITGQPLADIRSEMSQFSQQNPVLSLVSEGAGALGTGAGLGAGLLRFGATARPGAAAARAFAEPRILPQTTMGALEGMAYGAATAEPGQELRGAAIGGGLGGVGGAVATPLINVATRRFRPGMEAEKAMEAGIEQRLGRRPTAEDYAELQARAQEQPMLTAAEVADVSKLAQTVSSLPTGRQEAMRQTLEARGRGAADRMVRLAHDLTGAQGTPQQNLDRLNLQRQQDARPLYEAAYAADFNPADNPELIHQVEIGIRTGDLRQAYNRARIEAMREGEENIPTWRELSSADDPTEIIGQMDLRMMDRFKRGLDGMYRKAVRDDPTKAVSLLRYRQALVRELDQVAPDEYRQARAAYAGPTRQIEAQDAGRAILREDADVQEAIVRDFSEAEREAYVVSATQAIANRLRSRPRKGSGVAQIPEYVEERMRWAFPSDEAFDEFLSAMDLEADMQGFKNLITSRSPTADILAGQGQLRQLGGAAETVSDVMQGNLASAARRVVGGVTPAIQNPLPVSVGARLADMLMSQGSGAARTFQRLQQPAVMPRLLPPISTIEAMLLMNQMQPQPTP